MNSLSWLIYLAGALPSIGHLLGFLACLGMIASFAINGIIAIQNSECHQKDLKIKQPFWMFPVFILMGLLSAVTPSRETVLLIAASEIGEKAAQTEEAQDLLAILRKELKKLKEAK